MPAQYTSRLLARAFAQCAVILAAFGPGVAREVTALMNEFSILREFSAITIAGQDIKAARVFVDTERFVVSTISEAENGELRKIVVDGLSSKLQLVNSKNEANYLVQIRMYQSPDYAIRNPRNEFARGLVLLSICKFPIKDQSEDCGSLTY